MNFLDNFPTAAIIGLEYLYRGLPMIFPNKTDCIFDLDGTLIDSMPVWADRIYHLLDEQHISYPDDIIRTLAPMDNAAIAVYLQQQLGLSPDAEEILSCMQAFIATDYRENIPAKATVPETLAALKASGLRLHVLTASPHCLTDVCLKRLGLWELFDTVWSCEDFALPKTDENIYRRLCEKIGAFPAACVFADDNYRALKTAKRAGLTVVGVFDESDAADADSIRAIADRYVITMNEIL